MADGKKNVRIAAVGDLHVGRNSQGTLQQLFTAINEAADIVLLCGDLTDYGLPEEAHILTHDLLASVRVPVVGVLGNHDFESGKHEEISSILCDAGVNLLDGDACELLGVGFAGVKGFAGGFGRGALGAWGEESIKQFVHEAVNEALKLESALARLRTASSVVVLHYSPIRQTVEGEPPEIFPFLGSSRLEEPLGRYAVTAIFHGHAHNGTPEGQTTAGTPVYNVSMPLLRKTYPERPPFRLLEVSVQDHTT